MQDANAALVIKIRLKYDWIVLLFGFLCVFIQLFYKCNYNYFPYFVGVFIFVEVFNVALYRKLQSGGDGYHMQSRMTLDQQSGVGLILFCMVFDFAILSAFSIIYLVNAFKHSSIRDLTVKKSILSK